MLINKLIFTKFAEYLNRSHVTRFATGDVFRHIRSEVSLSVVSGTTFGADFAVMKFTAFASYVM